MKYHTVVNEVKTLQKAYAVHALACMCVKCLCMCEFCACACARIAGAGLCLWGGCGDNGAIKEWSLSRENQAVRVAEFNTSFALKHCLTHYSHQGNESLPFSHQMETSAG